MSTALTDHTIVADTPPPAESRRAPGRHRVGRPAAVHVADLLHRHGHTPPRTGRTWPPATIGQRPERRAWIGPLLGTLTGLLVWVVLVLMLLVSSGALG